MIAMAIIMIIISSGSAHGRARPLLFGLVVLVVVVLNTVMHFMIPGRGFFMMYMFIIPVNHM